MLLNTGTSPIEKTNLHPRNRHRFHYDFEQLIQCCPELFEFISLNKHGNKSIDFSNPAAVKALNRALLKQFYGILNWDIPATYLCPPIPGRADYIHYMADLLSACNDGVIPQGHLIRVLDIGVGANCVYPIIGHREYGWHFVGSDIDSVAINSANLIIASNDCLHGAIECRLQTVATAIFKNIINPSDVFDISMCNPPFHASLAEASAGTKRKWKNLGRNSERTLNFGGQNSELWCEGGEEAMVHQMIEESAQWPTQCFWYSTLISKKSNLPGVYRGLRKVNAFDIKTIEMAQGQKVSRIVAWTFLDASQQKEWKIKHWM
jgi:23S rRNA (adenine1618-N6)-methyltransferase